MAVNTPSAYYETMLPKWTRCRDAAEGSDAVKAKGTTYLPMVNVNEQSAQQYDEYLFRAMWYPATGRTITLGSESPRRFWISSRTSGGAVAVRHSVGPGLTPRITTTGLLTNSA